MMKTCSNCSQNVIPQNWMWCQNCENQYIKSQQNMNIYKLYGNRPGGKYIKSNNLEAAKSTARLLNYTKAKLIRKNSKEYRELLKINNGKF